jgi:hypothetical protein
MNAENERRRERRLRYNWPIWFSENFSTLLTQGQMVDLCSSGAAFTCYSDRCPEPGEKITARFSVPRYGDDESFDMENFIRDGEICRIDEVTPFIRRVAVQFGQPLPFKPGENADDEAMMTEDVGVIDEPADTVAAN